MGMLSPQFPGGSAHKESVCRAGDPGSFPGPGRSLGEENSYPTPVLLSGEFHGQRAWQTTVHGVTKSRT